MWATLRFPPINLYSVYPTKQQCRDHANSLDKSLWDGELNETLQYEEKAE